MEQMYGMDIVSGRHRRTGEWGIDSTRSWGHFRGLHIQLSRIINLPRSSVNEGDYLVKSHKSAQMN